MKKTINLLKDYFFPPEKIFPLHECFLVHSQFLIFLRMCLFLFSFGIYTMSNILRGSFYKNYMYLTYWGEVLTMLTFLTLLIDNILHFQGYKENVKQESHLSRAAHFLFETAFSYELTIVLMYWFAVYPTQDDVKDSLFYITNILVHGVCLLLLWIENIFNTIEFYPRHMILVVIVGLSYIVDNVIVVFCINFDTVYKVLKWTDLLSYVYVIACILVALCHFCLGMFLFNKWKFKKWGHMMKNRYDIALEESHQTVEFGKEQRNPL